MRATLRNLWPAAVVAVLLPLTIPLAAQQPAPGDLVVKLTKSADGVKLAELPKFLNPGDESTLPKDNAVLRVSCSGGADCTKVTVVLDDQEIASASASKASATFRLTGINTGDQLLVSHGDVAVVSTQIRVSGGQAATAGGGPTFGEPLLNPCEDPDPPDTLKPPVGYDRKGDRIVVRVSPTGSVLQAPAENMDENDQMVVHVLADPRLASRLDVKRKSTIRTVGSFNIVGGGTPLPKVEKDAQSELLAPKFPPCKDFKFILDDFAPGKGEVEISNLDEKGKKELANTFDFLVHKLYHGMFTFGALRSDVSDRAFSLAPQGDEKIIVVSENGGKDTFYSVLFTPFIWEARDIEKEPLSFLERFNPTFGVTVDDFSDNVLVGASFDYNAFVISAGLHLARVQDLSEESKLKPGDPFAGEASEIPTTKTWEKGLFLGVSIDFRAAVQLLQTVITGGDD